MKSSVAFDSLGAQESQEAPICSCHHHTSSDSSDEVTRVAHEKIQDGSGMNIFHWLTSFSQHQFYNRWSCWLFDSLWFEHSQSVQEILSLQHRLWPLYSDGKGMELRLFTLVNHMASCVTFLGTPMASNVIVLKKLEMCCVYVCLALHSASQRDLTLAPELLSSASLDRLPLQSWFLWVGGWVTGIDNPSSQNPSPVRGTRRGMLGRTLTFVHPRKITPSTWNVVCWDRNC